MKALLYGLFCASLFGQVVTADYDVNRTNATLNEPYLTPSNLSQVKLLGKYSVDDRVFAQPLCVLGVTIGGIKYDLVIVVTMNDSIYAFNLNSPGSAAVWSNVAFDTSYGGYPQAEGGLYGNLGCLSTPWIDASGSKVWAVCDSATGPTWKLRSFSLTTGSILTTTSITGQVTGTGDVGSSPADPTSGPNLLFFPQYEFQRTSIAECGGTLYIGFGGFNDSPPWHGWLFAYRESDQAQLGVWNGSPNGFGSAIWMSGGAPVIDGSCHVFVTTGNGGGTSTGLYTNSVIALSSTLTYLGSWTTSLNSSDNAVDADVSANRLLMIPGTNLLAVAAGKDYHVTVIDANCLIAGGSGTSCQTQDFMSNVSGVAGSESGSYGMAFANNAIYLPTTEGNLYRFAWTGSTFNTTGTNAGTTYGWPGPAQIAVSCSASTNCIVWTVTWTANAHTAAQTGTLRALNATTLAELWNDGGTNLSNGSKFVAMTVINGKVIVPTMSNKVPVFGLVAATNTSGLMNFGGQVNIP